MRYAALMASIVFLAGLTGCHKQGEATKPVAPKKVEVDVDTTAAGKTPKAKTPDDEPKAKPPEAATNLQTPLTTPKVDTPPPPAMPKVFLSDAQKPLCVVQVGDTLPPGELKDADGKSVALAGLLGKRATVVIFWDESDAIAKARAATALDDLQHKVAGPMEAQGVNVVAINVGDAAEVVKAAATAVKYPVLSDSDRSYFAKISKHPLPCVYLLDPSGNILWFDIEFTRDTQRKLLNGLAAMLGGT